MEDENNGHNMITRSKKKMMEEVEEKDKHLVFERVDSNGNLMDLIDDSEIKNFIFCGYDGSFHTTKPLRLGWHKININNEKIQPLPSYIRHFPDDYNLYIVINTKTGMHVHIEDDFMLNQIVGKKKIYFLDYEHLTIKPFWSKYQNFSRENFFRMHWDEMDIYYAELEPGDSVCIPPWWWHAVESKDYTIGVAKLWEREDQYELYRDDPKYLALYRRNWFSSFMSKWFFDWVRKTF